jgi:hypothetical protein
MNEQELIRLSSEVSELARSVKIDFKNPESLQENVIQLNKFEQRLLAINKKIKSQDSAINKILTSIRDATENITSTGVNTIKITAKLGLNGVATATKVSGFLGSKIAGNAIPINILSQVAEFTIETLSDLLGGKLENISEQIQIISQEQKISKKEAIKQLTIVFSIKVEQLTVQCCNLKQFINKCIEDNLFFQKVTAPNFPKLEAIEKEVEQLTQEIKQDFRLREIEVMKKQFEQIENAQARLVQIDKNLSDIVEILKKKANNCVVFDSDAMEVLLTTLNQEIIYLRICPINGIVLCLNGEEETINDIDKRFNQVNEDIKKLTSRSNKKYDKAKNLLCKASQKKEAYKTKFKEKPNSQQKLTESSNESSKSKGNSLIPILIGFIIISFSSWIGWNFITSKVEHPQGEHKGLAGDK